MLKITLQKSDAGLTFRLDGRLSGEWVAELERVWMEQKRNPSPGKVVLDLREVTFASDKGTSLLKQICKETQAAILATTPWAQALSAEVKGIKGDSVGSEDPNVV